MVTFQATISSRSSRAPGGPPGESEVLARNPDRGARILAATGWSKLAPGSLNLEVAEDVVHRLLLCAPVIRESAEELHYPDEYAHIPSLRVGYLYFSGCLVKGEERVPVLFRRAMNPLRGRIEAFSDELLRAKLALFDGDAIVCEVNEDAV